MDGSDAGEIVLIDDRGCPTDTMILGELKNSDKQVVEAKFEAFKFPTSDVVQFKALVTPCVTACEPVNCGEVTSMGRRKRSTNETHRAHPTGVAEDNLIVVKTLRIEENFAANNKLPQILRKVAQDTEEVIESQPTSGSLPACFNSVALLVIAALFLIAQLAILVVVHVWRQKRDRMDVKEPFYYNNAYASHVTLSERSA